MHIASIRKIVNFSLLGILKFIYNFFKANNPIVLGRAVPNFVNVDLTILVVRLCLEGVFTEDTEDTDIQSVASRSRCRTGTGSASRT
mgnify:CR=1 FL=1